MCCKADSKEKSSKKKIFANEVYKRKEALLAHDMRPQWQRHRLVVVDDDLVHAAFKHVHDLELFRFTHAWIVEADEHRLRWTIFFFLLLFRGKKKMN